MSEPRVPGGRGGELSLPCGRSVSVHDLDMGMREFACPCGGTHAVVMDMHPLSRWVPEDLVAVLRETVGTTTGESFDTVHVMGMVLEEFPEAVASEDTSEDGHVGFALVWVTDFDSRRLHEVVVELLVELMEHAVSHASDESAMTEFERQMLEFDVGAFVEQYRAQRDFDDEFDRPA
ncbi:DUF5815 family protein [Halomarina ordinaria]|uniref:DUF5815 family protein n=1 Tax=Halomarina ordinaria TaxID=3033939 RepID=A0ABD5U6T0_9EURY|nr:DUF5815 family protein [Halomarina sp. PSRA2]